MRIFACLTLLMLGPVGHAGAASFCSIDFCKSSTQSIGPTPGVYFMCPAGDTGSLSLGGALGAISVAVKHEIVLAIIGGLFVVEAVSVMIQVVSFKLTGKRVFRMAPIHHHYEKLGWAEPTIVIRFWIIAVILALIGLASLKLR